MMACTTTTLVLLLCVTMLRSTAAFAFQPSTIAGVRVSAFSSSSLHRGSFSQSAVQRLHFSSSDNSSPSPSNNNDELINLAKTFLANKNAAGGGKSSLDGVFDMCSPSVDLYGLKGDDVRPGFTSFFGKHEGLYHELLEEPSVVGEGIVQYPFIKKWSQNNEELVWKSIDPAKPRNKVERLWFDSEGKLEKVSVVEADALLD